MIRVLFVCTGNICRSPTAHGVFEHLVREAGLAHAIEIDSAGTSDYHVGESPDRRAAHHSRLRGYDLDALVARQVHPRDFARFDYILAMDRSHLQHLRRACPPEHRGKVRLFLDFAPEAAGRDVPDPYYGGADGFEEVLDLVEAGARGLLEHIRREDPAG